ncbi:hypothetical protein D3C71_526050 [compost metagenome]
MLELSEVLKSTGNEVLVKLFQDYNDHYLETDHLDLSYTNQGQSVTCTMTARTTALSGVPGRYKGVVPLTYKRANVTTLLNGYVEFTFTAMFPFSFSTMAAHLKGAYGLVLEAQDVLQPTTGTEMTDLTMINEAMATGGVVEFRIADKSPRFLPKSSNGGSVFVRVVDPNGGELAFLSGTRDLGNVSLLDA